MAMDGPEHRKGQLILKHVFDRFAATGLMVALLPLLAVIAGAIKIDTRGPVFFRQNRVGRGGRDFVIYKFRTMVDGATNMGLGLSIEADDPRITRVGALLRKWSLDELPQLINIIKGEMSIVGPRPTVRHQVEQYSARQRKRLAMRPGVTGWAQVNGRNTIPWETRIELDIWYVENWSLLLDARILLRTVFALIDHGDIYNDGISYDFGPPDGSSATSADPPARRDERARKHEPQDRHREATGTD